MMTSEYNAKQSGVKIKKDEMKNFNHKDKSKPNQPFLSQRDYTPRYIQSRHQENFLQYNIATRVGSQYEGRKFHKANQRPSLDQNKILNSGAQSSGFSTNQSVQFKNDKQCFHNEKAENKISSAADHDNDEDGWVTVKSNTRRKTNYSKIISEVRKEKTSDEAPLNSAKTEEKSVVISLKSDEEKLQAKLLRKMRIKEEKTRKREEKARILRDKLRRDTKINVISQEMVESFLRKSSNTASYESGYRPTSGPYFIQKSAFNAAEEYPTLKADSTRRKIDTATLHSNPNSPRKEMIKKEGTQKSVNTRTSPSRSTNFVFKQSSSLNSPTKSISEHQEGYEIKKKVKSKDRINLAITSLLEIQKQKKPEANVKPQRRQTESDKNVPKPIETHVGKVREHKKVEISTLKKNMLRERKRQTDLLRAILKEGTRQSTDSQATETIGEDVVELRNEEKEIYSVELSQDSNQKLKPSDSSVTQNSDTYCNLPSSDVPLKIPLSGKHCTADCDKNTDAHEIFLHKCNPDESEGCVTVSEKKKRITSDTALDRPKKEPLCLPVFMNDTTELPHSNKSIVEELAKLMDPVHCNKFREYCDHVVTPEVNVILRELILQLVTFQDRLHKQDPIKARIKRRFYCGLKEAWKHMNRLTCLIMAPNLKPSPGEGCLDEVVTKLLNSASDHGVPVIFGLTKREIGRLCHKKVPVSCFAIVNYQGAQDKFHALMDLMPTVKKQYEKLVAARGVSPVSDDETEDIDNSLGTLEENVTDSLLKTLRSKLQ